VALERDKTCFKWNKPGPFHIPHNLAFPALSEFRLDLLDQPPFLGEDERLVKVRRVGGDKALPLSCVRINGVPVQRPDLERPVRVQKQSIHPRADHRLVAAMFFERRLDVLLEVLICGGQRRVHINIDHLLLVGRQCFGNVFERDERGELHQESPE